MEVEVKIGRKGNKGEKQKSGDFSCALLKYDENLHKRGHQPQNN